MLISRINVFLKVLLSALLSGANGQSVARRMVTAFIDASASCSASRAGAPLLDCNLCLDSPQYSSRAHFVESVDAFVQHMRVVLESVACATAASSSSASPSAWLASRPHVELVEASLGALDLCLAAERQRQPERRALRLRFRLLFRLRCGRGARARALRCALAARRAPSARARRCAAADEKRMLKEQRAKRLVLVGLVRRALGVLAQIAGALPHEQHTPLLPLLVLYCLFCMLLLFSVIL